MSLSPLAVTVGTGSGPAGHCWAMARHKKVANPGCGIAVELLCAMGSSGMASEGKAVLAGDSEANAVTSTVLAALLNGS